MKTEELIKRMLEEGYEVDLEGIVSQYPKISFERLADQKNNENRYNEPYSKQN